jgi:23S rRNA (uracil1939-C5)-methyltransferase
MKLKKKQEIELTVTGLALGGRGIAKPGGFTVFVDQAVPGDRVLARIVRKKRAYAEARATTLIEPSPDRIRPPCPYSGVCGGCKWQFLAYDRQLDYKRQHVVDALVHIGGIAEVPVHATIPSTNIFGYRNKMEFTCTERRWLMPAEMADGVGGGPGVGLHVPGTFFKVLDIAACLLQPALGNTLLEAVRKAIFDSGLPIYGLRSHAGFWRFLVLRHSAARDQWMANIVTSEANPTLLTGLAQALMDQFPELVSVVNNVTSRKAGIAVGESENLLGGSTVIHDQIGPYTFAISANSFFQTNTAAACRLYDVVKSQAGLTGGERVLDLYSGTGTIPIWLADAAAEVVGFELVESAVLDARRNCADNGIDNCRFVVGDLRHQLPAVDWQPDVMIIDPPRAGMHKAVVGQVLERAPRRIVYVSCNPATLARDLALLTDRYTVAEVQPVDMFPHTTHIESVARLEAR